MLRHLLYFLQDYLLVDWAELGIDAPSTAGGHERG